MSAESGVLGVDEVSTSTGAGSGGRASDPAPESPPPTRERVPWSLLGAVAAGGVVGAEARFGLGVLVPHPAGTFPWATFGINVSGCVLIGVLMAVLAALSSPHHLLRPFVGVGVLGGYTTFSTYAVDVEQLLAAKHPVLALVYLVATVVAALVAVALGLALTTLAVRAAQARRMRRADAWPGDSAQAESLGGRS